MGRLKKIYGPLALGVFLLAWAGLLSGCPFLRTWFYLFAWWSYIFFVDWLVRRRRGSSRLSSSPKEFLQLSLWSAFIWFIFEWFNLFLKNWSYVHVPSNLFARWIGYVLAFATVLPGIFETYDFLETLISRRLAFSPCSPQTLVLPSVFLGMLSLALPLAYPRLFFPLVWVFAFLLLEPALYLANREASLLRDLEQGSLRRPFFLLLSGLICGLFWESWNYWAGTKWIYHLPWPWLMRVKLFEMPLAGYLGFPPFALECWSLWQALVLLRRRLPSWLLALIYISFLLFMCREVDHFTVRSFGGFLY
ncbi:hypothetical protein FVE67_00200 [Thermosulfurimonas marina]|uniref:Uncharacterized protein n=1 Tax=Thermosulfurimonas marina TaxID=2047767 RepID=A0A6H1WQ27_9BACT|nr:hypothetical protein [Thermosulfurimonas marina]QJA05302.1 hypothetical protein FVE67_00200 [Thermosulfurimonas marina]